MWLQVPGFFSFLFLQVNCKFLLNEHSPVVIMKVSLLCSATFFTLATFAFPANILDNELGDEALAEITELAAKITREAKTKRQLGAAILPPGFNADAQRISTTGRWRYVSKSLKSDMLTANSPVRRLRQAQTTFVGHVLG